MSTLYNCSRLAEKICLTLATIFTFSFSNANYKELETQKRPNVILIYTDDQSENSLGFTGGEVYTPRIDQLAREGIVFSNAHVSSTVCSPSRYTTLTGRYAGRCTSPFILNAFPPGTPTRIENNVELEQNRSNLARTLQSAGYKTGFVGKSHLIRHELTKTTKRWEEFGLMVYPGDADPKDPEIDFKIKHNHRVLCQMMKAQGFDYADGVYLANLKELYNDSLNVHNLEWTVDKALTFIEQEKDNPFFLYYATTLHHGPNPWLKDEDKFTYGVDANPCFTGEGYVEKSYPFMPARTVIKQCTVEAGYPEESNYAYWLDAGVDAIMDKIESLGLAENTLVIFVSDHGLRRYGKSTLYDGGMQVPCLMYWKGTIEAGRVYKGLIQNIDYTSTILDVCGVDIPEGLDGLSLKDVLLGSDEEVRTSIFAEIGYARALQTRDWKYIAIRYPEDVLEKIERGEKFRGWQGEMLDRPYLIKNNHLGFHSFQQNPLYFEPDQLFDLRNDPEETVNVYDKYPEIAEEMKAELKRYLLAFPDRPFGEFVKTNE